MTRSQSLPWLAVAVNYYSFFHTNSKNTKNSCTDTEQLWTESLSGSVTPIQNAPGWGTPSAFTAELRKEIIIIMYVKTLKEYRHIHHDSHLRLEHVLGRRGTLLVTTPLTKRIFHQPRHLLQLFCSLAFDLQLTR